ncbi:MAG: PEP-CTERM sorting domain-containing protein [Pedosphaera sp.]|nr:PEP-CTERM sorting domain-containing protein [Pedosphaera sp.]
MIDWSWSSFTYSRSEATESRAGGQRRLVRVRDGYITPEPGTLSLLLVGLGFAFHQQRQTAQGGTGFHFRVGEQQRAAAVSASTLRGGFRR